MTKLALGLELAVPGADGGDRPIWPWCSARAWWCASSRKSPKPRTMPVLRGGGVLHLDRAGRARPSSTSTSTSWWPGTDAAHSALACGRPFASPGRTERLPSSTVECALPFSEGTLSLTSADLAYGLDELPAGRWWCAMPMVGSVQTNAAVRRAVLLGHPDRLRRPGWPAAAAGVSDAAGCLERARRQAQTICLRRDGSQRLVRAAEPAPTGSLPSLTTCATMPRGRRGRRNCSPWSPTTCALRWR